MESEKSVPGEVRLDRQGNVEVFDGQSWTVIDSIYNDAGSGIRNDPDPDQRSRA